MNNETTNRPCNLDHNGECLICDCWLSNCAYDRYLNEDYTYETKEELEVIFKGFGKMSKVIIKQGDLNWDGSGRAYPDNPEIDENWDCIWEKDGKYYKIVGSVNHAEWDRVDVKERELSLEERGELFRKTYPGKSVDDFAPSGMEVQSIRHQLDTRYNKANIPTKLITITYKDDVIESYR